MTTIDQLVQAGTKRVWFWLPDRKAPEICIIKGMVRESTEKKYWVVSCDGVDTIWHDGYIDANHSAVFFSEAAAIAAQVKHKLLDNP